MVFNRKMMVFNRSEAGVWTVDGDNVSLYACEETAEKGRGIIGQSWFLLGK